MSFNQRRGATAGFIVLEDANGKGMALRVAHISSVYETENRDRVRIIMIWGESVNVKGRPSQVMDAINNV